MRYEMELIISHYKNEQWIGSIASFRWKIKNYEIYLFHEEESDPLEHLVAVESRYGHVEKETVQYGRRNVG